VDKVAFPYGTVWNMFKHITAGCSRDEKQKVFSGTAKRVYRLA
jgi:L-fuconolactonase